MKEKKSSSDTVETILKNYDFVNKLAKFLKAITILEAVSKNSRFLSLSKNEKNKAKDALNKSIAGLRKIKNQLVADDQQKLEKTLLNIEKKYKLTVNIPNEKTPLLPAKKA